MTDNGTIPNPEKTDEEIFEEYLKRSTGCLTYLKSEKLGETDGVSIFYGCTFVNFLDFFLLKCYNTRHIRSFI